MNRPAYAAILASGLGVCLLAGGVVHAQSRCHKGQSSGMQAMALGGGGTGYAGMNVGGGQQTLFNPIALMAMQRGLSGGQATTGMFNPSAGMQQGFGLGQGMKSQGKQQGLTGS